METLNKTRISLFYLATYLLVIGFGLLLAPNQSLALLQSTGDYGDIFPRLAGMLMSGLGISIVGLIRANAVDLYPATLFMRAYFTVCLIVFYLISKDPLFIVITAIVLLGFSITLTCYLSDLRSRRAAVQ